MDMITDNIFIGNHVEAHDEKILFDRGIRSILSLDGSYVGKEDSVPGIKKIYAVELIDGPGNSIQSLELLTRELIQMAARHSPVLIHCHAGRSRSVAAAAAYLVVFEKFAPAEAIEHVRSRRSSYLAPELERLVYRLG
ncbi:MAG: dual specificity protein phosphatase family protein [Phycisphaeraceae bacterium]